LVKIALGRPACHSPGVYGSSGGFLPPTFHPQQHHQHHQPGQYQGHRGGSPQQQHSNHGLPTAMGPPHHHHLHQSPNLQHLHYRQPPTCKYTTYYRQDKNILSMMYKKYFNFLFIIKLFHQKHSVFIKN
jgi:hypothetical protein